MPFMLQCNNWNAGKMQIQTACCLTVIRSGIMQQGIQRDNYYYRENIGIPKVSFKLFRNYIFRQ